MRYFQDIKTLLTVVFAAVCLAVGVGGLYVATAEWVLERTDTPFVARREPVPPQEFYEQGQDYRAGQFFEVSDADFYAIRFSFPDADALDVTTTSVASTSAYCTSGIWDAATTTTTWVGE